MSNFDIDNCTVQEACDYAIKKIVEQGKACINNSGACAYADGHNNHCAVGWLLPADNRELMDYEGTVEQLTTDYDLDVPDIITDNIPVFLELQKVHDAAHSAAWGGGDFQKRLKNARKKLKNQGINTDKPIWQKWFEIVRKVYNKE